MAGKSAALGAAAALLRRLHAAGVLVGPGGVGEQAPDREIHLAARAVRTGPGQRRDPAAEVLAARRQILGGVVEHLRPVVRRGLRPAGLRLARGLDGVAHVFAVALPHLAEQAAKESEGGFAALSDAQILAAPGTGAAALAGAAGASYTGALRGGTGQRNNPWPSTKSPTSTQP